MDFSKNIGFFEISNTIVLRTTSLFDPTVLYVVIVIVIVIVIVFGVDVFSLCKIFTQRKYN